MDPVECIQKQIDRGVEILHRLNDLEEVVSGKYSLRVKIFPGQKFYDEQEIEQLETIVRNWQTETITCLDLLVLEKENFISTLQSTYSIIDKREYLALEIRHGLRFLRSIIQKMKIMPTEVQTLCEHDAWLNKTKEQQDDNSKNANEQAVSTERPEQLNYFAPTINLQVFLKQEWFSEFRTNDMYNEKWTDGFISALMATEWKEIIARNWAVKGGREKKNQIKGYITGLLKNAGVLKGSYLSIAAKIGIMDKPRSFSKYMGQGNKQPYSDWVKGYVTGLKEE